MTVPEKNFAVTVLTNAPSAAESEKKIVDWCMANLTELPTPASSTWSSPNPLPSTQSWASIRPAHDDDRRW